MAGWLAEREALWASLEERDFAPLPLDGSDFDPFDVAAVNAQLQPHGLVYGAGHVAAGRASFLLGRLERADQRGDLELLVCGIEQARGLAAPPAALQGSTVLLRRQSLAALAVGEVRGLDAEAARTGAFKAALAGARLRPTTARRRCSAWPSAEGETLVLHECGEFEVGRRARARLAGAARRAAVAPCRPVRARGYATTWPTAW